jgi:hypothetical protein
MSLTRALTPVEIRVLGALMEKQQTTPDAYPLTIKAVLAAANQKSNREPVTDFSETEVVEALDDLRRDVLAWRHEGARAERWEHCLDRRWKLDGAKRAVMTLLMLRGPQTPGELRGRSERLHTFDSVEDVEGVLAALAAGDDPLVRELPREPGQRESRWIHQVGTEATLPPAAPAPTDVPSTAAAALRPPADAPRRSEIEERLERLEASVADLATELRALRLRLGDLPPHSRP